MRDRTWTDSSTSWWHGGCSKRGRWSRSFRLPYPRPGRSDGVIRACVPGDGCGPGPDDRYDPDARTGRWLAIPCGPADSATLRGLGVRRDGGVIVLDGLSGQGKFGPLALRRALPFALALRGHVVLHASAVEVGGGAVAFVGESGVGKSTLARELGGLGCRVLSDDLLRVEPRGSRVLVPAMHAGSRLGRWVPLRFVFFLARSADVAAPEAQSLGAVEFLGLLVRNGFGELRLPDVWALQLAVYHRIVLAGEGARLVLPEAPGAIPAVARAVAGLLPPSREVRGRGGSQEGPREV